jgi:hypothetical protein
MFIIVISIKKPSKKNLNLVTMETMKIAYKKETSDTYEVKMSRKKGFAMKKVILAVILTLAGFASIGDMQ